MTKSKVAISIVTYNSRHIFDVLENLKKEFGNDKSFRILIFDNNSSEEYKQDLKKYRDFAEITFHNENKGFGFGHNSNLMKSPDDYFLVFNPDIILEREPFRKMLKLMEDDTSISLLVPKVLNSDGTTQHLIRNRVTVFDYALRFIPFKLVKKIFDKRLSSYECRDLPDDKTVNVLIGSGCFMLLRGKAFQEVGGFDERYFMYFEDYDLCLKFSLQKKRVVYTPFSNVIHYYERGAHKSFKLFKIFIISMIKFFNKWGWKFI
ncbi:glycosyltransferase family 2 protein [Robertmurraya yapensis]|uniref:Glycosyltransferase family 2 protein n=1 Tax=Bacillus yapensis TaxID=2492960 RepID=A0A431WLB2_9BACI|nr:glycosyltransferase family 2 protein [Bacillus yapensis]RTR36408.1 glycosyltransferase family 2 protein [Bacillus yapensis]TKT05912.1 glycosyltransferase [Bacillus yapensis]